MANNDDRRPQALGRLRRMWLFKAANANRLLILAVLLLLLLTEEILRELFARPIATAIAKLFN